MLSPNFKALLLDIEGTTTPISFVNDKLFPYAMNEYDSYIRKNWEETSFQDCKSAFGNEDPRLMESPDEMISFVHEKHRSNEKHPAFKALQGMIWKSGYENGTLKAIIYHDVPDAFRRLQGIKTYIYSSGSIDAQKLLFKYSDQGDLTAHLSGYNDTLSAGSKLSGASYTRISEQAQIDIKHWLFLSDNVKEVEAAQSAGMNSWILVRDGNAPLTEDDRVRHHVIQSFNEL